MLDSGVILMRGQERGMGGADGWMVRGGGVQRKGSVPSSVRHPSIRCATAIRMKNLRRREGGRGETRSRDEGMGRATSLMSDRIHLQCGIITLIAEWMICQCMRGEYIYVYCAEGERGK